MAELSDLERLAPVVDVDMAATQFRRASRQRRRRRTFATASLLGVIVGVALVAASLVARDDDTPVVAGPGSSTPDVVTISSAGFGSHVIIVHLPAALAPTQAIQELAASIDAGEDAWRVDARRVDGATAQPPTCSTDGQPVATRRLDGWVVEISGDPTTDDPCPALRAELEQFGLAEGMPVYRGSWPIGDVDSPLWWASVGGNDRLSVFERPCSFRRVARTTGLLVSSAYYPAGRQYLSVLCDDDLGVEVWLTTATQPDRAALEQITVEMSRNDDAPGR